jgi:hypothetical protein
VLQSLLLRAISLRSQCLASVTQLALKLEHTAVVTTLSMLARRACAQALNSLPASSALAARSRSFTAATATQSRSRAPALADITPSSAASFNKKQQEFREGLAAEQKQREQQESKLFYSHTAHAILLVSGHWLYWHNAGDARDQEQESGKKKGGALSSLIYGTPEGRELDKDIERSFSQVLARGKYVHSIVFHEVKPDKTDEYTELVGKWYPKMASIPENKVHLVGSWRTEVGDCNTFGKLPIPVDGVVVPYWRSWQ